MKSRTRLWWCLAALIFLGSCATTTLTAVWKEPGFHGAIRKVVVIGSFRTATVRNVFEDDFVAQLRAHGVDAIASYTLIPLDKLPDEDFVMQRVKAAGADAVLVTRLLGRRTIQTYVPGTPYIVPDYYRRWGPYYQYLYTPGYMAEERYAYAETNMYDTVDNRLIWSARSETQLEGRNEATMKSFIGTIVDRLLADGLIG